MMEENDVKSAKRRKAAEARRQAILAKSEERMKKVSGMATKIDTATATTVEDDVDLGDSTKDSRHENDDEHCYGLISPEEYQPASMFDSEFSQLNSNAKSSGDANTNSTDSISGSNKPEKSAPHQGDAQKNEQQKYNKNGDIILVKRFHVVICIVVAILVRLALSTELGRYIFYVESVIPVFIGMDVMMLTWHRDYIFNQENSTSYLQTALQLLGIKSQGFAAYTSFTNVFSVILEDFAVFFVAFVLTHAIMS